MKSALGLASLLLLMACGASSAPAPTKTSSPVPPPTEAAPTEAAPAEPTDSITAAIASTGRPDEDRARDADRNPDAVLRFMGVESGMKVLDLMAGRGYYTELLAGVVGPSGAVYAQNNAFVIEKFAEKPLSERLARLASDAIIRVDQELDGLSLPAGQLDIAFMGLFYHDTFWMNVDRTKMNTAIFAGLRPGGLYVVTDHHAEAGSKDRDVQTLHRIDAELVKADIIAAGFEFVSQSDVLAHPDDVRDANVFDESIRGKTDRFVYKFRRPN